MERLSDQSIALALAFLFVGSLLAGPAKLSGVVLALCVLGDDRNDRRIRRIRADDRRARARRFSRPLKAPIRPNLRNGRPSSDSLGSSMKWAVYRSYAVTGERGALIARADSLKKSRSICLERARAGMEPRTLIYGEEGEEGLPRYRRILIERWIPPWFPGSQPKTARRVRSPTDSITKPATGKRRKPSKPTGDIAGLIVNESAVKP